MNYAGKSSGKEIPESALNAFHRKQARLQERLRSNPTEKIQALADSLIALPAFPTCSGSDYERAMADLFHKLRIRRKARSFFDSCQVGLINTEALSQMAKCLVQIASIDRSLARIFDGNLFDRLVALQSIRMTKAPPGNNILYHLPMAQPFEHLSIVFEPRVTNDPIIVGFGRLDL
jgi:hypothetical protein